MQFFAKNLTQTGPFTVLYKRNQSQNGHSDGFDQNNEGTEVLRQQRGGWGQKMAIFADLQYYLC